MKMKTFQRSMIIIMSLTLAAFFITACQKSNENVNPQDPISNPDQASFKSGEVCETPLMAGQSIPVGNITTEFMNNNTTLKVTYMIDDAAWCLNEVHLDVQYSPDNFPMTKKGNPQIGHFAYKATLSCEQMHEVIVDLSVLEGYDETLPVYIAAHAVVWNESMMQEETAWGMGEEFPGNSWAMYFQCEPNEVTVQSETAYAYADPSQSGIPCGCFIDLGIGNNWGWMIGPFGMDYTFDLWAGAGQCNLTNGTHVGTLTVDFKDGNLIDVTYNLFDGFSMDEVHLWIDESPWGGQNISPGQFPYKADGLGGASNYSFSNISYSGNDIYLIAHAVVF